MASLRRSGLPAEELYRSRHTLNGVALLTDEARLDALRAMPGVKAVRRLVPKRLLNSSSVPFVGAPAVWDPQGLGATGAGVRVGIIDTGVDYIHKDLGGNGSYSGQHFDDSNVPWTSKVVGGYDFVGDDYDGTNGARARRRPHGHLHRPRQPRRRHGGRPRAGRGRQHLFRPVHAGHGLLGLPHRPGRGTRRQALRPSRLRLRGRHQHGDPGPRVGDGPQQRRRPLRPPRRRQPVARLRVRRRRRPGLRGGQPCRRGWRGRGGGGRERGRRLLHHVEPRRWRTAPSRSPRWATTAISSTRSTSTRPWGSAPPRRWLPPSGRRSPETS